MCLVNDTDSSAVCVYYIHRLGEEYVCGCNVCGCVCLWVCLYEHMDPKMCVCVWLMILIVVGCVCIHIGWVRSMSAGVMYVGGCVCLWVCMYVHMDPKMCECVWLMILIVVVCVYIHIGWVRSMSAGVMYVGVYVCGCVCMCIWIQRCVSVSG